MSVLRARGLVKRFGETCAVNDVDLELRPGEIRALLGANGAGKTTLLRMLLGLVTPDEGSIELLGRRLSKAGILGDGVAGFVEDPAFYPYLSGRANLELLAELDGAEAYGLIDGALERVGMEAGATQRVSGYSTGMRQRLGIAASLLRAPRLLLLDEPTSGLDPGGSRDVRALVAELAGAGVAVLLSSHLIGEVAEIADSFTILRAGSVAWSGTAAELQAQAPTATYALSTSDDRLALQIAAGNPAIDVIASPDGALSVSARDASLDAYVVELGRAGVAVRQLQPLVKGLEAMYFSLTEVTVAGERAHA